MPFFLLPLAIGGAVGGLSILEGFNQQEQYDEAADAARDRAEAEAQRNYALAEQEKLEEAARDRTRRKSQKRHRDHIAAQYAKSGLTLRGTPLDVLAEQAEVHELENQDQSRLSRYRQQIYSYNAKNSLIAGKNQADSLESAGDAAKIQGLVSGALSLGSGSVGAFGGGNALLGQLGLGAGTEGGPLAGLGGGAIFGGVTSNGFLDAGKLFGAKKKQPEDDLLSSFRSSSRPDYGFLS